MPPSNLFNSEAEAVITVPERARPLVPSCEAMLKLYPPSLNVVFPVIVGVLTTGEVRVLLVSVFDVPEI